MDRTDPPQPSGAASKGPNPKKRKRKPPLSSSTPEPKATETERKRVGAAAIGSMRDDGERRAKREANANANGQGGRGDRDEADDGEPAPIRPTTGIAFTHNKARTNSSARASFVMHKVERPGQKTSKKQRQRANRKRRKISGLPRVVAHEDGIVEAIRAQAASGKRGFANKKTAFDLLSHFYQHRTDAAQSAKDAYESNKKPNWVRVPYDETTTTIEADPVRGTHYATEDRTFICTVLPRAWALEGRSAVDVLRHVSTHQVVLEKVPSIRRGTSHCFNASGGYAILGHKARRNGGVTHTECPDEKMFFFPDQPRRAGWADCADCDDDELREMGAVLFDTKEESEKIQSRVQHKADAYIHSELFHGLREGLGGIGFKVKGKATTTTSSAWSRDFQAAMHVDKDANVSYMTVTSLLHDNSLPLAERVRDNLELDDPKPAIHFMFPAHNLAVPVCPGDIIIFNPALYHGCSAKLAAFDDADVNLMSMYLKAAVVGGNDNKIPVPPAVEKKMAKVWAEKDGKKSDSPEKEEEAGQEEPPSSREKSRPKAVQWNVLTRSKAAEAAAMEGKSDDEECPYPMSSVHADEDEYEDDEEDEDSEDDEDDDDKSEDEDEEDGDCEDEEVKSVLPKAVLPREEPRNEPRESRTTLKAKIVDCPFSVL
jgi:hypothetical protein